MKQLVICIQHVGEYRWRNLINFFDITMSNPVTTRVIYTNFGAISDLSVAEKDNLSVDNNAVICIFRVNQLALRPLFEDQK